MKVVERLKPAGGAERMCLLVLALALGWLGGVLPALANGAPVSIFLSYLPTVSNWGPQTATGTAVVGVADQEVTLDVKGLPELKDAQYQVWLQSRTDRKLYPVGQFNTGQDGAAHFHALLDDLPYQEYRLLMITREPVPDPSPDASGETSLAGYFPATKVIKTTESVTGTVGKPSGGAAAGTSGVQSSAPPPGYLPVTGAPALAPAQRLVILLAMAVPVAVWLAWRRRHA